MPVPVPQIKAGRLGYYQNITNNSRTMIGMAADGTGVNSLTNNVGYWNAGGTFTNIFTPSAGATTPYMCTSRDYAFFTDGEQSDLYKWDLNTQLWNWGIAAPTSAPSIAVSSTGGSNQGAWSANTVMSTMGLLVDTNNNVQSLVSVNVSGTNTNLTVGSSGPGTPNWNQTGGGTTSDTGITWTNRGPIGVWQENHFYNQGTLSFGTVTNPSFVYDTGTNSIYMNDQGGGGTSGTIPPGFKPVVGGDVQDGSCKWQWVAFVNPAQATPSQAAITGWQPSTYYTQWFGSSNFSKAAVVEPCGVLTAYNGVTNTFNQPVYMQTCSGGTTPATESQLYWAPLAGQYTDDGNLRWLNLGSKTWAANTAYTAWATGVQNFSAVEDSHGNMQICIISAPFSGASITFPTSYVDTNYGNETVDSGAVETWAAVGPPVAWSASTKWFLPTGGFVAPASTSAYGGVTIIDSTDTYILSVVISGKSASSGTGPTGTVGTYITDNTVTWYSVTTLGTGGTTNVGAVTLASGRYYYVVYQNSISGGMSAPSPVSPFTGVMNSGGVYIYNIPVSPDPQVNTKIILTTADGGNPNTLYYLATIANSVTSYPDNTPETTVLLANVYQETDAYGNVIGVYNNNPPPLGSFPTSHKGRIWLASGSTVYFSKSLADVVTVSGIVAGRYEEAFNPANALDISPGAERITGLLSDGFALYIGTERHVRRIFGDSPTNFQLPNVIFSEAGVMNQNVWQIVFMREQPVGCMWLTPDFRCIRSDFNIYLNVGEPIQNTLNSINPAATAACWATYVGYNTYNFYCLAICTGSNTTPDTMCVYDLQRQKWYIWQFADHFLSGLFYCSLSGVLRWIMIDSNGDVRYVDPTVVEDRSTDPAPVGITSTWTTSWLSLGDPTIKKVVNEVEVGTTLPSTLVSVSGATTAADFANPNLIISNAPLTQNFLNEYKVFLAGLKTTYRFYQFTFTSSSVPSSTLQDVLMDYFGVEVMPISRI